MEPLYPVGVVVSPAAAGLGRVGETVELVAVVHDQHGGEMDTVRVTWSSLDTDVVTVGTTGMVVARSGGAAGVVARAGSVSDTATVTVDLIQRPALLATYEKLGGDEWTNNTNWGTHRPLDTWFGVAMDGTGNVVGLLLQDNGLSGEMPVEVVELEYLERLDFGFNSIRGTLPAGLGQMAHLKVLHLHHNRLMGSLPSELANLDLDTLDIHQNQLTGELPEWLGSFRMLKYLQLWGNDFTGSLPESLGDTDLSYLTVFRNRLSGPLPRSLMELDLRIFYWDETDLCSPPDSAFQAWLAEIPIQLGEGACESSHPARRPDTE